jgi:hypothetical protein
VRAQTAATLPRQFLLRDDPSRKIRNNTGDLEPPRINYLNM